MPPLLPGDPGNGDGEDRHDEDDVGFLPPLPPEDRLWRHPSEVAHDRATSPEAPAPPAGRGRTAALALVAGMAGAVLAVGAVALLGGFDDRVVERQVAVRPATVVDGPADGDAAALATRTAPSVAALEIERAGTATTGSAVVLRSDGYLLTDAQLVAGAERIDVVLHRGHAGPATVVGLDAPTGVAVLHVAADGLEPATLGRSAAVAVGTRAVVVGATSDAGWHAAVSTGVVSALDRRVEAPEDTVRYGMMVVDTPFAPGTVGGAVVDARGTVVGLASSPAGRPEEARMGMVTPIDLARLVADQLIADGHARHVWLGVLGTDLDADEAAALGLWGGAVVDDVASRGPADRAGVRPGDVVVSVDDEPTPSMSALIATLQLHEPGDVVVLGVLRDGDERTVRVTLAAKPTDG